MIDFPTGISGRIAWPPPRQASRGPTRPPRRTADVTNPSDEPVRRVEAALFLANGPLSAKKLADVALLPDAQTARKTAEQLGRRLDDADSAFRVVRVAAGYRLVTSSELAPYLDRIFSRDAGPTLTTAAAEVLAVIAYRQPITRADVESFRRTRCVDPIKQLLAEGLITVVGEEETLGRPYLYGTTAKFLDLHGLASLGELPDVAELRDRAR